MLYCMANRESHAASQEAFTVQDVGKALKAAGQASEDRVKFSTDEFGIHVNAVDMKGNKLSIVIQTDESLPDTMPIIYVEDASGKK
jgi:hypothetical protein